MSVIFMTGFREGPSSLSSGRLEFFSLCSGGGMGKRVGCLWTHESVLVVMPTLFFGWGGSALKGACISQSRDYAIFSGLQTSRFLLVCWGRFPVAWNGEKNLRIWLLLKQLLSHFLLRCLPPPPLTNESCIFLPMRWCEFCWCSAFLALGLGFGALSSAESSFQLLKFVDFCLIFVCLFFYILAWSYCTNHART